MKCPNCGDASGVVMVIKDGASVLRVRRCKTCRYTFYTEEQEGGSPDDIRKRINRLYTARRRDHD